jgi:hypothetical protein
MVEKKEDSPHITHLKQQAIKLEKEALEARRKNNSGDYIGDLYEKAGDLRAKAADFAYAEDDYVKSERFGYPYHAGKKAILNEKINDLRLQKSSKSLVNRTKEGPQSSSFGKGFAILSITSLLAALGFVSISLTGNVIAGLGQNDSRWIGLCFFICGLIFSFLYLKGKKR